jgi:thymidine phosphorylase
VLSKKVSAGSQRVLIDAPVGPTTKLRSCAAAEALTLALQEVGSAVGLQVRVAQTDGSQPIGRGIGPALEAWDVLAVLQGESTAPKDLRERALLLAGQLLEFADRAVPGQGYALAKDTLDSGRAWVKFQAICSAQGGMREPPRASYTQPWPSPTAGVVTTVDNRRIAMAAKLAGAPAAPAAGVTMEVKIGQRVERGQPLFWLHAQSPGELDYALAYVASQEAIVELTDLR